MLINRLKELVNNSYAPYSHFLVAAIVTYEDGSTFEGVNIENNSFGATICAERSAISSAITQGKSSSKIKEVHIFAKNTKHPLNEKEFIPPCGICRQVISNFASANTKVILWNNLNQKKEFNFSEILPHAFSGGNIDTN